MADVSSIFILSFSSSLFTTLILSGNWRTVFSLCVYFCVPVCIYPPLIQPRAASVPCRLNVSSLTLMSSHNLFVCLCGLPCCPHNVRQSIIMWPTYIPRLPTALVIHPLACTVHISDLPLPLSCPVFPTFTNNACLAMTITSMSVTVVTYSSPKAPLLLLLKK